MTPEAYRELYLAPLRMPRVPGTNPLPALPPQLWFAPPLPQPPVSLKDLYDTGVRAGHGESRALLESRIDGFDRELQRLEGAERRAYLQAAAAEAELGDARRLADRNEREQQAALQAARDRVDELENSTFWRMTGPLRAVLHIAKRGARVLVSVPRYARVLSSRFATARQIAKDQGVTELARRIATKTSVKPRVSALRPRNTLESAIRPLHVPTSAAPRVSVIMPTYGQDLYTFTALVAVAHEALQTPLEVLVADDCAPIAAQDALRDVTGVRFLRSPENLGFLRNCNRAAGQAVGEWLLFLNNDAVLCPGAIEALLAVAVAASRADAGAVGAKLVYPDGRLQEAGGIVWRDGSAWNYGRGDDADKPEYNYVRAVDYCSAACLLMPRALFESLGGFDQRYSPAYYEDTDLCFAIRAAGKRVYYQPAAEVVHFEGVSHGTDLGTGLKAYQVENRARFAQRWEGELARHRTNGMLPRLERDRGARLRVLFVEATMLTPDQDSGSLRTLRLLRVMREMGCKVTFVAANLEYRNPYVAQLQQEGVEVVWSPHVRSLDEYLRLNGADFGIVVLARYYIANGLIDSVRRHAPRALLVFDTLDLHFIRNRRLAHLEGSAAVARSADSIYTEEIDCIRRCDVTWVVSEVEREIVLKEVPRATVLVQSNIHDAVGSAAPFAAREGLLFVGGFRHPPNVDAAFWLARDIAPLLSERLPGVTTYLIGSNPPRAVRDIAAPGIEFVGYVPELESWMARCRVSVSPLRYGAGVKGKVNQAMSHGLPVVATRASIEGMHLVEGEEVLVADDPVAFADAVAQVYRDEMLWNRLSRGGIANVVRHFSPAVAAAALQPLLEMAERRIA